MMTMPNAPNGIATREETMNRTRLVHPPRQQTLGFTRDEVGRRLPRAAHREVQALLAQMLVEVVRVEIENEPEGGEHGRQDP